jgi:hypothetical protein
MIGEEAVGWHFLKLESEDAVAMFRETVDAQHRADGSPQRRRAFQRIEPRGWYILFLNPAASAVVLKLPFYAPMLRRLHPALREPALATAKRLRLFSG